MQIAIRVDASSLIGAGHVMRCLTLANELKSAECNVTFYCKNHHGNLNQYIVAQGFQVVELSHTTFEINQKKPESWLACSQVHDAEEIIKHLINKQVDWLIIDHYAIEKTWQKMLKPYCEKIMVIDDLANRHHDCDLLLDQTLNRSYFDYQSLVPEYCQMLLGNKYILLRKEFSALREQAKQHRKKYQNNSKTSLLITMGACDPDNISEKVINAIELLIQQEIVLTATVVLSSSAQHLTAITKLSNKFDWLTLLINAEQMPVLMLNADIAIGASGSTAWERCCLGLPTISIVCARNQQLVDDRLKQANACVSLGYHELVSRNDIAHEIMKLLSPPYKYNKMSECAINICDGIGTKHVMAKIKKMSTSVTFRLADKDDVDVLFSWQSQQQVRRYYNNPEPPSWSEHTLWFEQTLHDKNKELYIALNEKKSSIGMIRLDRIVIKNQPTILEISILVAPKYQKIGLGLAILQSLKKLKTNTRCVANVHKDNIASHRLFLNAGFNKITETSYQLDL